MTEVYAANPEALLGILRDGNGWAVILADEADFCGPLWGFPVLVESVVPVVIAYPVRVIAREHTVVQQFMAHYKEAS